MAFQTQPKMSRTSDNHTLLIVFAVIALVIVGYATYLTAQKTAYEGSPETQNTVSNAQSMSGTEASPASSDQTTN